VKIIRQCEISEYKGLSLGRSLAHMYKTEGVKGYFKGKLTSKLSFINSLGNGINVIRVAPFSAFEFFFYEMYKNLFFSAEKKTNNFTKKFVCGGFAGMSASTLTYPLDLIRTFLTIQTSEHKTGLIKEQPGIVNTGVKIFKTHGFLGLYKGWFLSMLVHI
jgi:solute carrier family 25 (mitochondrial phosphate transporter), member 23/24/25/41